MGSLALVSLMWGCSGSDFTEPFATGSLEVFEDLHRQLEGSIGIGESSGPGGWHFSTANPKVAAGTAFFVTTPVDTWEGYVLSKDGVPHELESDHETRPAAPTALFLCLRHQEQAHRRERHGAPR